MFTKIHHIIVRRGLFIVLIILLCSTFFSAGRPVAAEEDRVTVYGDLYASDFTVNCPSPIGLCSQGPISGNLINGNLLGIITSITQNPSEIDLTATVTITTKNGQLFGDAILVEHLPTLFTTATLTITGGTGRYSHSTGVLYFTEASPTVNGVLHVVYTGWLGKVSDD